MLIDSEKMQEIIVSSMIVTALTGIFIKATIFHIILIYFLAFLCILIRIKQKKDKFIFIVIGNIGVATFFCWTFFHKL
jgi:hypothetical protein